MHPKMVHIAGLYQVTQRLFDKASDEIKPEDVSVRPSDRGNSFLFVAGHITAYRYSVAALLGLKAEWPHKSLFERGAEIKDAAAYPSFEEIKKTFDDITLKINKRFDEVTEADLSGPAPFKMPGLEETSGGIVAFLAMHEAYHVGQLAYILRLHGGERLVG